MNSRVLHDECSLARCTDQLRAEIDCSFVCEEQGRVRGACSRELGRERSWGIAVEIVEFERAPFVIDPDRFKAGDDQTTCAWKQGGSASSARARERAASKTEWCLGREVGDSGGGEDADIFHRKDAIRF